MSGEECKTVGLEISSAGVVIGVDRGACTVAVVVIAGESAGWNNSSSGILLLSLKLIDESKMTSLLLLIIPYVPFVCTSITR